MVRLAGNTVDVRLGSGEVLRGVPLYGRAVVGGPVRLQYDRGRYMALGESSEAGGAGGGGTITIGGSSGGSGSGAPSPHDLNSVHHTGSISDAQAPQFLKADGSRNLTGNLVVTAGVTVDGVDISAHAADPDAHHDRVTVGNTGLSLSTQQLSLNLATTSGLQISSGLRSGHA